MLPRSSEYSNHRPPEVFSPDKAELNKPPLQFASHGAGEMTEWMRFRIDKIARRVTTDKDGNDVNLAIMRDAHYTDDTHGIYVVADGVGHENGSGIASQTATAAFAEAAVQRQSDLFGVHNNKKVRTILHDALAQTDQAVRQALHERQDTHGSGTTLTSAIHIGGNRFAFVNVGDSAAFVVDPQGSIARITTEQGTGTALTNYMNGSGRPKHGWQSLGRQHDEIVIREVEPGSHILLCTDGLIGDTLEQRIDPRHYAREIMESSDAEDAVLRLLDLPGLLYRDENAEIRPGVAKPKIDDSTAVVIKVSENDQLISPAAAPENTPSQSKRRRDFGRTAFQAAMSRSFGKFGEYTSSFAARASKSKRTPDSATNIPQEPKPTESRLPRREHLRKFGTDIHNTIVATPWIKFEAYKASLSSRNFEYKTPSKRKLAAIGGIALAAAGTFAAVRYGVDMPDFNMPDVSVPFNDIVDGAVEDMEDALSGNNPFNSTIEGFAIPETTPPSITLQDVVSSPMEAWNGASSNTGFFSGTVYDQIAKTTTGLAHDYKIGFDINTLRQQSPTFEHSYHTFVDNVLRDNNLTWEQAAQLPADSTLNIDGDHIHSFFDSQDIALPPIESSTQSASTQETSINPALIASVIAAGAAASLGAWLAARRHNKRKNSTQTQG